MGGGGGGLALNQLLVVMDGIDNPPFMRRVVTSKINTLLDAIYVVPRRIRKTSLRLPPPRPRREQVYFIGATNVPMEQLDPALIRPGRLGRHVWFRTPTKHDREDIFDLYLGNVDHDLDLDSPERRDELARVTNGYSPAMVEQVVSMALTIAHHTDREEFGWEDLTEAMTTLEAGTAVDIEYVPQETRARIMKRFEQLGLQIMNRTSGGGPMAVDPISSVLSDGDKRRSAAQILGQAYVAAYNLVAANKDAVERVADALVEKRELFGDELVNLLDSLDLRAPEPDYTQEDAWPRI
jgi:hypothetical protein